MLMYENELRLSDATMREYERVRDAEAREGEEEGWLAVVEAVQKKVCEHFGVSECVGFDAMRCAETLPQMTAADIQDVRQISHYRKFNRCQDGSLEVNDACPSTTLWRLLDRQSNALSQVMFPDVLTGSQPLLVLAASYS